MSLDMVVIEPETLFLGDLICNTRLEQYMDGKSNCCISIVCIEKSCSKICF